MGKLHDGSTLAPTVDDLSDLIEAILKPLRIQDTSSLLTVMKPTYVNQIKFFATFTRSQAVWTVGQFTRMLSTLKNHFDQHPSSNTLDVSVVGKGGTKDLRATLRMTKVYARHYKLPFSPAKITPTSDILDVYIYLADTLGASDVDQVSKQCGQWIMQHNPRSLLPFSALTEFKDSSVSLQIVTPEIDDITYERLLPAFSVLEQLRIDHLHNQWYALSATILDFHGQERAEIQLSTVTRTQQIATA